MGWRSRSKLAAQRKRSARFTQGEGIRVEHSRGHHHWRRRPRRKPDVSPGRKWQSRTPAMAAGLTDPVWTLEELLSYRIPPSFD